MSVNAGQAQTRRTRACHATWYWVGSAFTLTRKRPFKSGTRRSELSLRVRDQVRHRRPTASARAAGWRGRRPRPGRRDRSAIPAPPRRCAAADPARAVAGSAGWWRRPARPPSPAPTVQTHQLRPGTSAPTVGGRTSSTPAAGAPAAACGSGAPVETVATPPRDQPRADSLGTTSSATCSANSTGCRSGMVCTSVAPSAAYSTTSATNASTSTSAGRVTRTVFWMLS